MPDFGIFRGFNDKLFGDKLYAGQLPTQLGLIGSFTIPELLLDLYPGAAAAYSLRKLNSAYTGSSIRVRRTDLQELDIGFTSTGELDTAALVAFAGSSSAFVTTWYDQSENGRNATQSTALLQPTIVDAGNLIAENGKIAVRFNQIHFLKTIGTAFNSLQTTIIAVSRQNINEFNYLRLVSIGSFSSGYTIVSQFDANAMTGGANGTLAVFGGVKLSQNVTLLYNDATKLYLTQNNVELGFVNKTVTSYGNKDLFIASDSDNTTTKWRGTIQEIIVYPLNQSANNLGIQTNINDFYSIY
jgi:hypothetical protein